MSKPRSLLEDLCEHGLSHGAQSLEVEYSDGRDQVFARRGETAFATANFKSTSRDAKELRKNLRAALRTPVRTAIGGRVWILTVGVDDGRGEGAFRVRIDPAPGLDPSIAPRFTKKQGQYLAFIYTYSRIHGRAPAESDLQRHFQTTPPSVHQMIQALELRGFIERTPGQARSIRVLVRPEHLPALE
ncbi:MAG: hypothetical protein JST11_03065 [Acidobacteria bacterium]|nr:hypothetical protein [Acidobacteriota bacterium]